MDHGVATFGPSIPGASRAYLQDGLIGSVRESDVFELNGVAGAAVNQFDRIWRFPNAALHFQKRKEGSHVHQRLLGFAVYRPEEIQWHGQLRAQDTHPPSWSM